MSTPAEALPLSGRVILITGATGGLGSAAASACTAAGATVVLLGRNSRRLEKLADALAGHGPEPLLYPLDLAGAAPDDYSELVTRVRDGAGRLDGVLHCAAEFTGLTPLQLTDPAAFARTLHVDLAARVWLSQACLPLLAESSDAALVFVVDDPRRAGGAYWGGYGLAQQAQLGLLQTLHAETANGPVRVAGLQPGPMRTALRARAYTDQEDAAAVPPDRYADACVTLLSAAGLPHRGTFWNPELLS